MAERWTSEPLELPPREPTGEYPRVDLVFQQVDHSGPSYEARLFIDNPAASESTPLTAEERYAGSFWIFGHDGCFGDLGHCDVPTGDRDVFDRRALHPLTPHKKIVTVDPTLAPLADAVASEESGATFTVTVVAIPEPTPGSGRRDRASVLEFRELGLVTYT
jgi:tyrosinase